jgi:hypothetical protein
MAVAARGPHIAFLRGRVRCPLAGIGERGADESNRLVVDAPATQVTIDGATITLEDGRAPAEKTAIADLVWLAEAQGTSFTIHLEVFKTGDAWSIDLHTHEPAPLADRATASYEPFTIAAVSRGRREVLVDPARLARTVARVPLARRLSSALMTTRDHLIAGPRSDRVVFDRSIGMGALGRGMFLVRARLARLDDGPISGPIAQLLAEGTWELSLEALGDRWLPELVARDLVLFGVPDLPLLADLRAGRLRRGQTLAFRSDGLVRVDDATAALPRALDLAREYLELHMLGGIVCAAIERSRGTGRA